MSEMQECLISCLLLAHLDLPVDYVSQFQHNWVNVQHRITVKSIKSKTVQLHWTGYVLLICTILPRCYFVVLIIYSRAKHSWKRAVVLVVLSLLNRVSEVLRTRCVTDILYDLNIYIYIQNMNISRFF